MNYYRFYIYGLFYRKNNVNICFYIGRGTGDRKDQHFKNLDKEMPKHLKILELRELGYNPFSKVLIDNLCFEDVKALEHRLLQRDDVFNAEEMTNVIRSSTGFGVGSQNPMSNPEIVEKMSEALKGRTPWNKGLKMNRNYPGYSEKMSRIKKGTGQGKNNSMYGKWGEDNPAATITNRKAIEIKLLAHYSGMTYKEIAKEYNVTVRLVSCIKRGKTWKRLQYLEPKISKEEKRKQRLSRWFNL